MSRTTLLNSEFEQFHKWAFSHFMFELFVNSTLCSVLIVIVISLIEIIIIIIITTRGVTFHVPRANLWSQGSAHPGSHLCILPSVHSHIPQCSSPWVVDPRGGWAMLFFGLDWTWPHGLTRRPPESFPPRSDSRSTPCLSLIHLLYMRFTEVF